MRQARALPRDPFGLRGLPPCASNRCPPCDQLNRPSLSQGPQGGQGAAVREGGRDINLSCVPTTQLKKSTQIRKGDPIPKEGTHHTYGRVQERPGGECPVT